MPDAWNNIRQNSRKMLGRESRTLETFESTKEKYYEGVERNIGIYNISLKKTQNQDIHESIPRRKKMEKRKKK